MWKKIMPAIGLIVSLFMMGFCNLIGKSVGNALTNQDARAIDENLIKSLNEAAEQSNRLGPRMVNEIVRLDTTGIGPGFRITYHSTQPILHNAIGWSALNTPLF